MTIAAHRTLLLAALLLGPGAAVAQSYPPVTLPDYWPTHVWKESSPEAQGMDSRELAKALDFAREHQVAIHSLLIVRNGRVVLDAAFFPYRSGDLHDLASGTKSVTTTLTGIAIGKKQLAGVRTPLLSLFPERKVANRDARKERLTIEDLLTMRSGLACEWMHGEPTLGDMRRSPDWIQFVLDLPMVADPGETFAYCSPGMHLLSGLISKVTGASALEYARRELFQPLGIAEADWPADPSGVSYGWGDLHLHPRDMAKLGLLWLAGGRWEDRQIIPAEWMKAANQAHGPHTAEGYGYGMWVYPDRQPPIFEANGRGGQRISVVPAFHLVVVMTGGGFEPGDIGRFIGSAIKSEQAIAETPDGKAVLDSAVARAARPPAPHPGGTLPALAATVSGKQWHLDANPIGLRTLALSFASPSEAALRLEFQDGRIEERAVGLDGVPRVSPRGRFGLPVAVSGAWTSDTTFAFDYDEVGNINCYQFRLSFTGGAVDVALSERTGLFQTRLRGR